MGVAYLFGCGQTKGILGNYDCDLQFKVIGQNV